jgi:hypothetical protein
MRVFTRKSFHQVVSFNLCPAEVSFLHFFFVMLNPPIPILKQGPYHDGVITLTDEVLVNYILRGHNKRDLVWNINDFRWCHLDS